MLGYVTVQFLPVLNLPAKRLTFNWGTLWRRYKDEDTTLVQLKRLMGDQLEECFGLKVGLLERDQETIMGQCISEKDSGVENFP